MASTGAGSLPDGFGGVGALGDVAVFAGPHQDGVGQQVFFPVEGEEADWPQGGRTSRLDEGDCRRSPTVCFWPSHSPQPRGAPGTQLWQGNWRPSPSWFSGPWFQRSPSAWGSGGHHVYPLQRLVGYSNK